MSNKNHHDKIERSVGLLGILTIVAISFGTLVQITPLMFMDETTQPVDGMQPYTALQLEGRDIHMHAQGSTMHLNITHKLHVCVQQPEVDLVHAPCHQTATLRYDN